MSPIQERNIAVCIILTIVTCGIYGIVWFISITNDMRVASGNQKLSGGTAFLLTLITCGIYGYYWAYQMGKATTTAQANHGMNAADDKAILYLILQLLGLGIINYALIQSDLNQMATPAQPTQNTGV